MYKSSLFTGIAEKKYGGKMQAFASIPLITLKHTIQILVRHRKQLAVAHMPRETKERVLLLKHYRAY